MTAIIVAKQPNCIHLASDAAIYNATDGVVAFAPKVHSIAHWPGCITCSGSAAGSTLFGIALARQFPAWDAMVKGATPDVLRNIFEPFRGMFFSEVWLAGFSAERGPECFVFHVEGELPDTAQDEPLPPFELIELSHSLMARPCASDLTVAAHFEGIGPDDDQETVEWSLRKLLTMQRHLNLPMEIAGIGGFGLRTTISREGVEQRIICRWPEDKLGGRIVPGPIDWARWHAENPKPSAPVSKLRRDMERRKLRVVR